MIVAGLLLLAPLRGQWGAVDVAWRLAVLGVGLFNTPNMTMAMSSAPGALLGTAGASISLARQLGVALGPALVTAVWAAAGYTPAGMRVALGFAAVVSTLAVLALLAPGLRRLIRLRSLSRQPLRVTETCAHEAFGPDGQLRDPELARSSRAGSTTSIHVAAHG